MNGKPYKPINTPSRCLDRYAVDHSGMLMGKEGDRIDIHALITNGSVVDIIPIATKVMRTSGLFPNGFGIVNRGAEVLDGSVVVVRYNGQMIIRRLRKNLMDGSLYQTIHANLFCQFTKVLRLKSWVW